MSEKQQIEKITKTEKNPNRVSAGKKAWEKRMLEIKNSILSGSNGTNAISNNGSNGTNAISNNGSNGTNAISNNGSNGTNAISNNGSNGTNGGSNGSNGIKSYDAHMYGVGILTILAVGGFCVYYLSDTKGEKKKNDSTTASNKRYRKML